MNSFMEVLMKRKVAIVSVGILLVAALGNVLWWQYSEYRDRQLIANCARMCRAIEQGLST